MVKVRKGRARKKPFNYAAQHQTAKRKTFENVFKASTNLKKTSRTRDFKSGIKFDFEHPTSTMDSFCKVNWINFNFTSIDLV